MRDYEKEFQRSIKFRQISLILRFAAFPFAFVLNLFDAPLWLCLSAFTVTFIIAVILLTQFKCPKCGTILDARLPLRKLSYCPHCRVKIHTHLERL